MASGKLFTGFGKVDYTPDFGVGLAGHGNDFARRNTAIVAHVYVTCVAARQDDTTVLLYTVDTCGFRVEHARQFRQRICDATGVPVENIFFGATHSHNCPTMVPEDEPTVAKTLELMQNAAVEAATTALADLAETEILGAKPVLPGLNFTRHYRLLGGKRTTSNSGMRKDDIKTGHLGPNDPQMVLVKFARKDARDIVLVNWQAHPDDAKVIGFESIAAGFVGPVRDKLEQLSDCHVAYFNGASGNQVRDSRIPELAHGLDWKAYGEHLAHKAFAAFSQLQRVGGEGIRTTRYLLPVKVNHTEDDKLEIAQKIAQVNAAEGKQAAVELCHANGLSTLNHAAGVRMRASMGQDGELELNALRIGNLAFANNTCETFSDQGLFIKNYSPFEYTVVVTGNRGYLASVHAFDYCAYEAVGGSAYYQRGTAEKMADKLVEMLAQLV